MWNMRSAKKATKCEELLGRMNEIIPVGKIYQADSAVLSIR